METLALSPKQPYLVTEDEIDGIGKRARVERWDEAGLVSLDRAIAVALALEPGAVPIYLSFDEDRPVVNLTSGPVGDAPETAMHFHPIDRRTAAYPDDKATGFGVGEMRGAFTLVRWP